MGRVVLFLLAVASAAIFAGPAAAATVVGDDHVESTAQSVGDGTGIAFQAPATLSRSVGRISVYLDRRSGANRLVVGLYADASGSPGLLLTRGSVADPAADAWNTVTVPPVAVTAGQTYWLAMLAPVGAGTLKIRERGLTKGATVVLTKSQKLSDLPFTWSGGKSSRQGPLSAYGSEGPVLSVAPTSLAFDTQRGQTTPAQLVQVTNAGDGLLNWSVTTDAPWLSVLALPSLGFGTISVAAVPGTLVTGVYHGTITVSAPDAQRAPQQIDVTLTVGDAVPPTVSLTAPGADALVRGTVRVTADASDASGVAGVQFLVDNTPIGAEDDTAPFAVDWDSSTAGDGRHSLRAVARDTNGNEATSQLGVQVDNTAPTAQIDLAPADPTNDPSPTLRFSSDDAAAKLACSLDGAEPAACTSPQRLSALADGPHDFRVQATDAAGNVGAVARTSWTVDTVAPEVTIDTRPARVSNDAGPSFSFSSERGASLACSLDGGAYADCASPQSYPSLPDGDHTFSVRATDAAGNAGAASFAWSIDTVAPTIALDSTPSDPSNDASPSLAFSSEPAARLECSLDGSPYAACTSPAGYQGLTDGGHSFAARATDAAGNTSDPATFGWTVDTTPPVATIDSGPRAQSNDASPSFSFSSEAGARLECSLDGADFAACDSPSAYAGLTEGSHSFAVRATDRAGNTGDAARASWTLDTTPPTISLTDAPADPSGSASAGFAFAADDPSASFRCSLDGAAATDCTSPAAYSGLADGHHTFSVAAVDRAGNGSAPSAYSWTIDATAPSVTISSKPASPSNDPGPSFAFDSEPGATFTCSLDGAAFAACSSPHAYGALADGRHTFAVHATDAVGNSGSASYAWTLDATAPTGSLTTPADGTTVSGTILLGVDAADAGTGVGAVQFTLDGLDLGAADTAAPFSAVWDTTTATDGPHVLGAVVRDAAGNSAAVPVESVTVKNAPDGAAGTQVDVGPGFVDASMRQVVRTAGDRVYIFAADDTASIQKTGPGIIHAYRADQTGIPATFSEVDAAHRARSGGSTNSTLAGVDARLDANGTVHLVYVDNSFPVTLVYQTFDTRSDQWGAAQVLASGVGEQRRGRSAYALTLDANDNAHVVYGKGTTGLFYTNHVSGSWSTPTLLSNDPATLHPSLAFDGAGNLHVAWLEGGTAPRIVYAKRLADGTWQGSDTVAGTDVLSNANADQGPSIVVTRSGVPYVLYVSALPKSAVRVKFQSGRSWVLDATPTDVFTHTPQIYGRGDDIYTFLGHDVDVNFGYEAHLAGQPWSSYQKLTSEQHDGSASVRWDPRRDNNPDVIDASYYDEDRLRDHTFLPELFYMAVKPTPNTAPVDTAAPKVALTAPAAGATLGGTVAVTASADDDTGVAGVQFLLDGNPLGAEDTTAPYAVNWDTSTAVRGAHTLSAVARDNAGHATTTPLLSVSVQNVAPSGLVGAWGFETACGVSEGGGGAFCDGSGLGNLAWTKGGSAMSPTGKFGQAASFDGSTGYLEVADASTLDLSTGMTLEAWVEPTALQNWMAVLFKEKPGAPANLVYALYANSDLAGGNRPSAHVFTTADQNFRAGTTLPLGAWTHLALTYDGASEKLYENGTLVGSKAVSGAMPATTGALHIGGDLAFGNEWFKGLVDEVRVYNRALSASEIGVDMATPVGS